MDLRMLIPGDPFKAPRRIARRAAGVAVFTAATACTTAAVMLATAQPAPPSPAAWTQQEHSVMQAGQALRPAAQLDSHTAIDWTRMTCSVFAQWERHPAAATLDELMADSVRVPWKGLGGDVWQLYGDLRADGPGGKYVSDDEQYVFEDCNSASGL
jgi:hypothetical protein